MCIGQWGILSLLIDIQAKQTHSTQAGTAARREESAREKRGRSGANELLTNATNEGESFWDVRLWGDGQTRTKDSTDTRRAGRPKKNWK